MCYLFDGTFDKLLLQRHLYNKYNTQTKKKKHIPPPKKDELFSEHHQCDTNGFLMVGRNFEGNFWFICSHKDRSFEDETFDIFYRA